MFSDTKENRFTYTEDIKPWENTQNFTFMRGVYEKLSNEFENISSEEELIQFNVENPEWVKYSDRGWQISPKLSMAIMNLVTPDGTIEIADALYKYTTDKIFIILDKDEEKLTWAYQNNKSDEENGVYIIDGWRQFESEIESRGDCSTTPKSMNCTAPQTSNKRVTGDWEAQLSATPNRDNTGLVRSWTISYHWDIAIKGQKRGFFGKWRRNKTRLGFVSGFRVSTSLLGSIATGTGWTVSSNVSSINSNFQILGPFTTSSGTLPSTAGTFSITYCTCGAKDANVTDLYCYDCCPWDCSDLDYNSF